MKCTLPLALLAALQLSACGTRSSLSAPGVNTECGPWSVADGVSGVGRTPVVPFAVLGDGSVALAMRERVPLGDDTLTYNHWVRKIDRDGEVAWDLAGGPHSLGLEGVARDAAEGLVVRGYMGEGQWSILGTTLTCPAGLCNFLGKVAETGTLSWSKVISSGGELGDWGDLAVTADGRITVEGVFYGTIDFGCGPLTSGEPIGNTAYPKRYLAQLSPSGECLWSRALGGAPLIIQAGEIAVDDQGEVALVLTLPVNPAAQSIDLGGGPVPFDTSQGQSLAVAKYTPSGDLVFAKVVIGSGAVNTGYMGAAHLALTSAGEVLISAGIEGRLDFGGGPQGSPGLVRQFVTKLSAQGDELWTRDVFAGGVSASHAVAVVPGGGFFLAGRGQPAMKILDTPTPHTALFVASYDADGRPVDVQTFPITGGGQIAGVSASADGALVLAGDFSGTLDFGQDRLVAEGDEDTFVARICR